VENFEKTFMFLYHLERLSLATLVHEGAASLPSVTSVMVSESLMTYDVCNLICDCAWGGLLLRDQAVLKRA
jgi:hypothetical protein